MSPLLAAFSRWDARLAALLLIIIAGCCALAPVVTIETDVYPKMTPPKVEEVMVELNPPSAHKD